MEGELRRLKGGRSGNRNPRFFNVGIALPAHPDVESDGNGFRCVLDPRRPVREVGIFG